MKPQRDKLHSEFKNLIKERFSIECRETNSKAITMANHNKRKQHNEPMRTRSKYTYLTLTSAKRGKTLSIGFHRTKNSKVLITWTLNFADLD